MAIEYAEAPSATVIYPNCDNVEYATTRLMSFCTSATNAIEIAVTAPTINTTNNAVCDSSNNGDIRATMKIPAVTMVAAWISAEIGVGPSIESGNQTCSGTCADFPIAPTNNSNQMIVSQLHWLPKMSVIVSVACWGALANTAA